MSCFSKLKSRSAVSTLLLLSVGCGDIPRAPEGPRNFVQTLEPDIYYDGDEESDSEKYVDYASREITACQWHQKLEKSYSASKTSRFRLFGAVDMRRPPKPPGQFTPIFIIKTLISVVEFFMPWNLFRGIDNSGLTRLPWGRIDMKAHSLNSYALIKEAGSQIPDREEFKQKVKEAVGLHPVGRAKLLIFYSTLLTGAVNIDEKRDEVVREEIEKVFPGLFSPNEYHDMSESLSWVLARNGLRQKKDIQNEHIQIYSRKLPVFRAGGWKSLSEDMGRGLGAAISGLYSVDAKERACASNIIFRSSEQLLQLMGQDTLPLYDVLDGQSYTPSLAHLTGGANMKRIGRCSSAGSLVRNGRRSAVSENVLRSLSQHTDTYSWAEAPVPFRFCKPEAKQTATGYRANSSKTLSLMIDRMEAFANYVFAMNPNARWWTQVGRYPLGAFESMKDIQDSGALAPMKVHALALGFLQLDLFHFLERHLVFLDENGVRTLDQEQALGIRLSEAPLTEKSVSATTSLPSALRFLSLVAKFDRYLASIEKWKSSSRPSSARINELFGSRENLETVLAADGVPNRELIQKMYLASSLMLLKFVDRENPGTCSRDLVTNLSTGVENTKGNCLELRPQLVRAFKMLARKLDSSLMLSQAELLGDN